MKKFVVLLAAASLLLPVGPVVAEDAEEDRQVVVYYFHGDRRCKTCLAIEANAKAAVNSHFAEQLESGELAWKTVNYDEPENEHFIKEFELVSSSLVVVEMSEGEPVKFEVLNKAWSLVRDKLGFQQYVNESVRSFLG